MEMPLEVDCALYRIQRVRELEEEAVANRLDLSSSVDLKEALDEALLLVEEPQSGGFILLGEGRVTYDIRENDGSEPTLGGHGR